MNSKGFEYLKEINNKLKEFRKDHPDAIIPAHHWQDSLVQERIMRLGREVRCFEINAGNTNELEQIAVATINEDFINNYK